MSSFRSKIKRNNGVQGKSTLVYKSSYRYENKSKSKYSDIKHHKRLIHQKTFQCENCKIKFSREFNLQQHMAVHMGDKLVECDVCRGKFIPSYLPRHKVLHKNKEALRCKICKASFTQKACLIRHMMIHTGIKPFKCEICNTGFTRKQFLTLHMTVHTGQKEFRCDTCKAAFARKMTLQQHMKMHEKQKKSMNFIEKCEKCNKTFERRSLLRQHMKAHNIKNTYQCDDCEITFAHITSLEEHMKCHLAKEYFQCSICKSVFITKTSLIRHIRSHSRKCTRKITKCKSTGKKSMKTRSEKRGKLRSSSKISGKLSEKNGNGVRNGCYNGNMRNRGIRIVKHSKRCGNQSNKQLNNKIENNNRPKKKKSRENDSEFSKKNVKKPENETSIVLNKCEICHKIFERRSLLRQHTKSHNEVNTYQCNECLLQFTEKNLLEEHCKQHILIDYFQCNECKFVYDRKSSLIQHIKAHYKEKVKKGNKGNHEEFKCQKTDNLISLKNEVVTSVDENVIATTPEAYRTVAPNTPNRMIFALINTSSCTIIRHNQNQNGNVMIICNPVNYGTTQTSPSASSKVLLMCNPSTSFTMIHRVPESQPTLTEIHDDPPQPQSEPHVIPQPSTKPTFEQNTSHSIHLMSTVGNSFPAEPNTSFCSSISSQVSQSTTSMPSPSASKFTSVSFSPLKQNLLSSENVPLTSSHMEFQPSSSLDTGRLQNLHTCLESSQYCENSAEKPVQVCDVSTCSSIDENLDNYTCDLCKIGFSTKTTLGKHIECHSNLVFYECDDCGDVFRQKKYLIKHIKGDASNNTCRKYHKCDICTATFSKKGFLQHHVWAIHVNENAFHKSLSKYKCVYCPSVFSYMNDFKSHVLSHRQKSYCVYCSASYNSKEELINHFKVVHFHQVTD